MKTDNLLFEIFEQQLVVPSESENEAVEPFAKRVVYNFLEAMTQRGFAVPHAMKQEVEEELNDEVIDMTRKKTYGFLSITEYQKSLGDKTTK